MAREGGGNAGRGNSCRAEEPNGPRARRRQDRQVRRERPGELLAAEEEQEATAAARNREDLGARAGSEGPLFPVKTTETLHKQQLPRQNSVKKSAKFGFQEIYNFVANLCTLEMWRLIRAGRSSKRSRRRARARGIRDARESLRSSHALRFCAFDACGSADLPVHAPINDMKFAQTS